MFTLSKYHLGSFKYEHTLMPVLYVMGILVVSQSNGKVN